MLFKVVGFNISRFKCSWTWRYVLSRSCSSSTNKTTLFNRSYPSGFDLKKRILKVVSSGVNTARSVLQNWVDEGHKVSVPELRFITRQLVKRRHFKPALELLNWMETQHRSHMLASDYAMRLELTVKEHGSTEAERYFDSLTSTFLRKAASVPLLRCYVKERSTEKAEAFMLKINRLGLALSPHPFNEMMKLYMATSQYQKVLSVILQMKQNRISQNVLSYNFWMDACGELSEVESAEIVYKEMQSNQNVEVGWTSLSTLANIYMKAGLTDKAILALKIAEKKISRSTHRPYFFLITQYASLNNKDGVLRVWEASKAVNSQMTCANYMCILSSFVKLGDTREAEKIFEEWESQCRTYDIRVSNILLGGYMRNGSVGKAESLHYRTLEKGGCPNSKTWEILVEGWIRSQQMDKAIDALKSGLAALKHYDWRPSPSIVVAIAEYFEETRNFENAMEFLKTLRHFRLANLQVYKSLLRMQTSREESPQDILDMMQKDGIDVDDETSGICSGILH
ncbi:PREDICTED: pentatricopeptide repeat-containing protein At5g27460 [Nicotiana attenuata]|uniref:Pentatricopeptide repeat-containing protein n=1 Tax=Nicotiana attenuata TaxID=49451 RepID=A0A1J6JYB8_NICAT|nr:PREDICTED: pentatricopeptide repeat-containing protein At5g27460 [Nicotiana attenuata]OIT22762.1 pentatricopeptide repeat-containing protein [Nicotiana attenuata]